MKTKILTLALILISIFSFANNGIDDPKSTISKVNVKRIVKVQKGVTNYEGKTGVYVYYVEPGKPNFNPACHKIFLTGQEYFDLRINSLNK